MNPQTEAELVVAARAAARDAHWTRNWSLAAIPTLIALAGACCTAMWFLAQVASAEANMPVLKRLGEVEAAAAVRDAHIDALVAGQQETVAAGAAQAIAAESVASDVAAMRLTLESRIAPLETLHQVREGRLRNEH